MTIGKRIRALREEAGIKQKVVADALHITNRMLSNYERDICEPSIEYIIALCKYFHVSSDYLLSLGTEKHPSSEKPKLSDEDERILKNYHRLNPEDQECIRGMMIALYRQEHMTALLKTKSTET